ncbi:MlaA family lipoprotein [Pelagicoccus mobilis]|uniref:VacJ family lipoprotein n=1 Tax=Pelagicoccus mobilis TaxID=415221 RepID=A0A934VR05_9BACT|nr:VacJ family lipoprotein [Pelagicoccus mobilis]MBK1877118.1 VacJ family lipoprotein [Pelagicoccus mobilis]
MRVQLSTVSLACFLAVGTNLAAQDDGLDFDALFEDDFEAEEELPSINDPFEKLNRIVFNFNDSFYEHIGRPFAKGYSKVMPDPVEKGLTNVFDNAKFPSRFAGNVLQGRLGDAGKETGQFLVNTTIGLGGFFRVADEFESLNTTDEDVGQALGTWGVGHGFYIVLPLIGPSSFRDFAADFADDAVDPIPTPNSEISDSSTRGMIRAIDMTNRTPFLMDLYDSMKRSAIDPYVSVRDAYTQRRARQVAD